MAKEEYSDSNEQSDNDVMENDSDGDSEMEMDHESKKSSKHSAKVSHTSHSNKKDHKNIHKNSEHKNTAKHQKVEYYDEGDSGAGKILLWTIVILIVIGIVIGVIFFMRQGNNNTNPTADGVAASVSGQQITMQDLNDEYSRLPELYRNMMTKRDYLEHVMVPQKILEKMSANIDKARIDKEYQGYLTDTNLTEDQLIEKIKEQGANLEKFRVLIRIQIYLNDTLGPKISVTDKEVADYYNASLDMLKDENNKTVPFNDIQKDIYNYLYSQKLQQETEAYLVEITKGQDIKIYVTDTNSTTVTATPEPSKTTKTTFKETGDELCTENGKPIIRLYSTTWCPHCKWIKKTFDETMKKYVDEGKIVAHHWEVDIKDDTLTDAVESDVPQLELDLFKKYSGSGSIPTFVFGCKYSRIGNGYEREGDLEAERAEFESLINELTANQIVS